MLSVSPLIRLLIDVVAVADTVFFEQKFQGKTKRKRLTNEKVTL